jgi:alpha-tubulin suppressor-like RCC1 family protein
MQYIYKNSILFFIGSLFVFLYSCSDRTILIAKIQNSTAIEARTDGPIVWATDSSSNATQVWSSVVPGNTDITSETITYSSQIPFTIPSNSSPFWDMITNTCQSLATLCTIVYQFKTVATPGIYIVSLGTFFQYGTPFVLPQTVLFQVTSAPSTSQILFSPTTPASGSFYMHTHKNFTMSLANMSNYTVKLITDLGAPDQTIQFNPLACQITTWYTGQFCTQSVTLAVSTTQQYSRQGSLTIQNQWGQQTIRPIVFTWQGITYPTIQVTVSNLVATVPGRVFQTTTSTQTAYTGTIVYTNTNPDPFSTAVGFQVSIATSGLYSIEQNHCQALTLASGQSCTVGIVVANTNIPGLYAQSLGGFSYQNLQQAQNQEPGFVKHTGITVYTTFDPLAITALTTGPVLLQTQSASNASTVWSLNGLPSNQYITRETIQYTGNFPFSIQTAETSFTSMLHNHCLTPSTHCVIEYQFQTIPATGTFVVSLGTVVQPGFTMLLTPSVVLHIISIPTYQQISVTPVVPTPGTFYIQNSRTWTLQSQNNTGLSVKLYTDLGTPDQYASFDQNACRIDTWATGSICTQSITLNAVPSTLLLRSGTIHILNSWGQKVIRNINLPFQGITNATIQVSVENLVLTSPGYSVKTTDDTGIAYTGNIIYTNTNTDPWGLAVHFHVSYPISTLYTIQSNTCQNITLASLESCTVSVSIDKTATAGIYTQNLGVFSYQNLEQAQNNASGVTVETGLTAYTVFDPIGTEDIALQLGVNISTHVSTPTVLELQDGLASTVFTYTFTNTDTQGTIFQFNYHITPESGMSVTQNTCQNIDLQPNQTCTVALALQAQTAPFLLTQPLGGFRFNNISGNTIQYALTPNIYVFIATRPSIQVSSSFSQDALNPNYYAVGSTSQVVTTGVLTYTNVSTSPYLLASQFTVHLQDTSLYTYINNCNGVVLGIGQSCTVGVVVTQTPQWGLYSLSFGTATFANSIGGFSKDFSQTFDTQNQIYFVADPVLHLVTSTKASVVQSAPSIFVTTLNTGTQITLETRFINNTPDPKQVLTNIQFMATMATGFTVLQDFCTGYTVSPGTYCSVIYALANQQSAGYISQSVGAIQAQGVLSSVSTTYNTQYYTRFIDEPVLQYSLQTTLSSQATQPTQFYTTLASATISSIVLTYINSSAGLAPIVNFVASLPTTTNFTVTNNQCNGVTLDTILVSSGTSQCQVFLTVTNTRYGLYTQSMGTTTYHMSTQDYAFTNPSKLYVNLTTQPEVVIGFNTSLSQDMLNPTKIPTAVATNTTTTFTWVFRNNSDETKEVAKNFSFVAPNTTLYTVTQNTCTGITLATSQSCTVSVVAVIPTQYTNWNLPMGYAVFTDINGMSFATQTYTAFIQFAGALSFATTVFTSLSMVSTSPTVFLTTGGTSIATVVTVVYTNTSPRPAQSVGLVSAILASPWSILNNTCTGTLPAGSSCTATIRLSRVASPTDTNTVLPGISGFNDFGQIFVATNNTTVYARFISPVVVSTQIISTLSTIATQPTVFSTQSTSITVNTSMIVFTNTSTQGSIANLQVMITIASMFTITHTCVGTLAPGASCTVSMVLKSMATNATIVQNIPNLLYTNPENVYPGQTNNSTKFYANMGLVLIDIAVGDRFSCGITSNLKAYCWGLNYHGQLGNGNTINSITPQLVKTPNGVLINRIYVNTVGWDRACAIDTNNNMYCWGFAAGGSLGDGNSNSHDEPTPFVTLLNVKKAAVGSAHTCALKIDNTVWCVGYNTEGEVGIGINSQYITAWSNAMANTRDIAIGAYHTCGVTFGNDMYCWGYNAIGQLGLTGGDRNVPTNISALGSTIAKIYTGSNHTCAISNAGNLYCWGYNYWGQVGDGTTTNKNTPQPISVTGITDMNLAQDSTYVLRNNGTISVWGAQGQGQLGNGTFGGSDILSPVNQTNTLNLQTLYIAAGRSRCASDTNHRFYCWGVNGDGQLGLGDTNARPSPTLVSPGFF